MKLYFERLGEGMPLLILHGFLGMSDNWHSIGKRLSARYSVYMIDLRNHGRSPHDKHFGYEEMIDDLNELADEEKIDRLYIIGHSMGGKLAMQYASAYPDKVDKLIVADMSPGITEPDEKLLRLMDAMQGFPLHEYSSLDSIKKGIGELIPEERLVGFVLKNIKHVPPSSYAWKPNVPVLAANAYKLKEAIRCDIPYLKPTLFVKGELSPYLPESAMPLIKKCFPLAEMTIIKGAGHWLHADEPEKFLEEVNNFLEKFTV
jgi:esterase